MDPWPKPAQDYCRQAEALLREGDPVRALGQLTIALEADPGHRPAYRLIRQGLEKLSAHGDVASFARLLDAFQDPQEFFRAGCRAMDLGRFRWAASLFRRADGLAPAEPGILIELAVALAHTNRFASAIEVLERIEAVVGHFWGQYELAWCYLCTQQVDRARPLVERLPDLADEDRHITALPKLRHFLRRLEHLGPLERPTIREWYCVQFGGALLHVEEKADRAGGRFGLCEHDPDAVAELLARFAVLMEKAQQRPKRVLAAGSIASATMAAALGEHWSLPVARLSDAPPERDTLVVAAAAEELYRAEGIDEAKPGQTVFVYDGRWNIDGYTCPDVAAVLSLGCRFPWIAERDDTDPDADVVELLSGRLLASLDAAKADPAVAYLLEVRQHLRLGNWDRYPHRPSYSCEVPLPTPTMM